MQSPWFFTDNGQYGEAQVGENFVIVDTAEWTRDMFDAVLSTGEHDRPWLARHLNEKVHNLVIADGETQCEDCALTPAELGIAE